MPTIRQKKAAINVVENGGNVSKAMIKAGYSKKTAKTPQKLTESKGWQVLMAEKLPDEKLATIHNQGLDATHKQPRITGRDKRGNPVYKYVSEPDFNARHRYLETAYKIKGKIKEGNTTSVAIQTNVNINLTPERIKQLDDIAAEGE